MRTVITRFFEFTLLFVLVFSCFGSLLPPPLDFEVETVKASPDPPTPDHEWKFEQNLTDTGSVGGYDLSEGGTGALYTSSSAHPNLGYALDLNGSNYVFSATFFDDINTKYGSTGFTITFWLKTYRPAPGWIRFIFKRLTSSDTIAFDKYRSTHFQTDVAGSFVRCVSNYRDQDGVWHFYVGMMAPNGTMWLYVNNVLLDTKTTQTSIPSDADANKSNFYVGYDVERNRYYANDIDELRVYSGLLTEEQRNELLWEGVEPQSGQAWVLRGNVYLRDKTVNHDAGLQFVNTDDDDGDGGTWHEIYIFKNMTLTLGGGIGIGDTVYGDNEIKFEDVIVYFNTTGAGFSGSDKWDYINYTNCKFSNYSSATYWNGLGFSYAAYSVYVKNVEIYGFSSRGINLINAQADIHIENVYMAQSYGSPDHGVYATDSDYGFYKNITMYNINHTSAGFYLQTVDSHHNYVQGLNITWDKNVTQTTYRGNTHIQLSDSSHNIFEDLTLLGWESSNDYPHKAIQVSGASTNNTFRNVYTSGTGNGFYANSQSGTVNYLYNYTATYSHRNNNADGIDSDKPCELYIYDSYIGNQVHPLSVEGGVTMYLYDTTIYGWSLEEVTTYRGDIYPANGTVYLFNTPIKSIALKPSNYFLDVYQRWNFTDTDINVTIHTRYKPSDKTNMNVTLVSAGYSSNILSVTVNAPRGTTSTTEIYCGSLGKPTNVKVNGVEVYNVPYNENTKILTVTVQHSSDALIEVVWGGIPSSLTQSIRSNYFTVIGLISLAPMLFVTAVIVGLVKGREELDTATLAGSIVLCAFLIIGTILMITILNAFIGL